MWLSKAASVRLTYTPLSVYCEGSLRLLSVNCGVVGVINLQLRGCCRRWLQLAKKAFPGTPSTSTYNSQHCQDAQSRNNSTRVFNLGKHLSRQRRMVAAPFMFCSRIGNRTQYSPLGEVRVIHFTIREYLRFFDR